MSERTLQEIGAGTYSCIEDMVNALSVDYDRLEELKDRFVSDDQDDALDDDELEELRELEEAADGNECLEDAERRIWEDPLSLRVRSGWQGLYEELEPAEYEILLSTGGPATRIIGELDQYGRPWSAVLQAQDWFKPWTDYNGSDEDILLQYASQFLVG